MNRRAKILVIDDEKKIIKLIKSVLADTYDVLTADNGESGIEIAKLNKVDLILIDKVMPKMDGIKATKFFRTFDLTQSIPIIMLTALKDSDDRLLAFNAGVDDFISKPFHPAELLARIEGKISRFQSLRISTNSKEIVWRNLRLKLADQRAYIDDAVVHLTPLEFGILKELLLHKGELRTREQLIKEIWDETSNDTRSLDSHIASIRRKTKRFADTISTVYGRGYILGD